MAETADSDGRELASGEKQNPVCMEIVRHLGDLDIPIGPELSNLLYKGDSASMMYGGPYALASGKIIRALTEHGPGNATVYNTLFGINSTTAWSDIEMFLEREEPDLTMEERRSLMLLELAEVSGDPRAFYNLNRIRTARVGFDNVGTSLIWSLLENSLGPSREAVWEIPFESQIDMWGNCKNSEFYLSATLPGTSLRTSGARCVVYVDRFGEPILYQKAGRYHILTTPQFSNATAINLVPINVSGVILPPGTLVGVSGGLTDIDLKKESDQVARVGSIRGLCPLRLTVYCMPRDDARIAFGAHYTDFAENVHGWRSPKVPDLNDFKNAAEGIIGRRDNSQ